MKAAYFSLFTRAILIVLVSFSLYFEVHRVLGIRAAGRLVDSWLYVAMGLRLPLLLLLLGVLWAGWKRIQRNERSSGQPASVASGRLR